jgi:hypothetical protein
VSLELGACLPECGLNSLPRSGVLWNKHIQEKVWTSRTSERYKKEDKMTMNLHNLGICGLLLFFVAAACSLGGVGARRASPVPTATQAVEPQSLPSEAPTAAPPQSPPTGAPAAAPLPGGGPVYVIAPPERGGFAPAKPYQSQVSPAVPPYNTDLRGVANPQLAQDLSEPQRALLQQAGFVVRPTNTAQIYQIYQDLDKRSEPVFVTTDALLHSYHILYDYTLRFAEINHFVADLQGLTKAMLSAAEAQMEGTTGDVQAAARRNLAFFAVAASLLDLAFTPPAPVKDLVSQELALIAAHDGFAQSPIFGYKEDYSQYVPRGHYTRNETFERYFRAMMWFGRIGFRLRPGEDPGSIAAGRMETRQAILIVAALHGSQVGDEPAVKVWERIYEPTVFFVGATDDLNVYDYSTLIRQVYGERFSAGDLADEARLDSFIAEAQKLRPPRILSGYVTDQQDVVAATRGFRFMGQRFVPDSYIFQQLVYNKVGTQDEPRGMPRGLDIPAALGSQRAYEILDTLYKETHYANYATQMEKMRQEFAALPPEQWTENLYWSWLYSLRPLLEVKGEGYPAFMQSAPWVDKDLHTFLGSWTELRHDTILYAKQSYAVFATAIQPPPTPAHGYVEPRPEVFGRLAALARQTREGLDARGLLNDEFRGKLSRMETLLTSLTQMAEKELAGQPLSEEEQARIRQIGGVLEELTTFTQEVEGKLTSEADERMAIVADVHTDPNTGQALEEGVGDAFLIYVIAPVDGRPTVTKGGVFSYYEFTQPMSARLTDEAWQALSPKPEQPAWTQTFIK